LLNADPGSALRIYAEDHPALSRRIRDKFTKRIEELAGQLAAGNAETWEDYKERVGVIKGLMEAIAMCDVEDKRLNGER
jgi:hypothetical protein